MIWLIPAVLLMGAVLLAFAFEGAIRADVYPVEAAEAPDPVDQQLDVYERAKYFTDEEVDSLEATATAPAVVAGADLDMSILVGEIYRAFNDYREGIEVCSDARREPSPEVQR